MKPREVEFDDVVQDAALIVTTRCRDWESGLGPADVEFPRWLWVRSLGDLKDRYKTHRLRVARSAPVVILATDLIVKADRESTPNQVLEKMPLASPEPPADYELIHLAVEMLDDNQRAAVEAIYMEGMTQEQYAEKLGVSQPAVSKLLARALRSLRALLT